MLLAGLAAPGAEYSGTLGTVAVATTEGSVMFDGALLTTGATGGTT